MFLPGVESAPAPDSAYTPVIRAAQAAAGEYPQIWHLFAFKPEATVHLERWCQAVMRGPSPLSPGLRELIAAFTSGGNHCPF
jgi:hypothetical protein